MADAVQKPQEHCDRKPHGGKLFAAAHMALWQRHADMLFKRMTIDNETVIW